jgi:hypothetical protein
MLKRILFIAVASILFISCGQVKEQQAASADVHPIATLVSDPMAFEGTDVCFEGIITHICQHSGDKMRVNQVDDQGYSIMVMLDSFKTEFCTESEGKHIRITGVLKTQVVNMDDLQAVHTHNHEHDGEEGHECTSTQEAMKAMQEKGIIPDVRTFIELKNYEIIEPVSEGCSGKKADVAQGTEKGKCC